MTKATMIILFAIFLPSFVVQADFLTEQKKFARVRTAIKEKQDIIEKNLKENQLTIDNFNLLFVAYKDNDLLEVYAKKKQDTKYKKINSYEICARSGQLGPKENKVTSKCQKVFITLIDLIQQVVFIYPSESTIQIWVTKEKAKLII